MADNRFPDDPHRDDEFGAQGDAELQPDPELNRNSANTGRMTLLAVVIALALGGVFYGLNNTHVHQGDTEPLTQTAQTRSTGMTTGSATNRPSAPQPVPAGPENYSPPSGSKQ